MYAEFGIPILVYSHSLHDARAELIAMRRIK